MHFAPDRHCASTAVVHPETDAGQSFGCTFCHFCGECAVCADLSCVALAYTYKGSSQRNTPPARFTQQQHLALSSVGKRASVGCGRFLGGQC